MTEPIEKVELAIYEAAEIEIVEVDNTDIICTSGMLEDEEVDIDMEDLVAYVVKQSKRDEFSFDPELVYWVVEAELDYEESLG